MAASVGVAAAAFLPWSRTGRPRSGMELARTLHEVGAAPRGALRVLLVLFLFTPVLAAAVWVAAFTGRRLTVAVFGAATGAVAVAAALVVRTSSLRPAAGVDAALSAGILAMAGAAVLALGSRAGEEDP